MWARLSFRFSLPNIEQYHNRELHTTMSTSRRKIRHWKRVAARRAKRDKNVDGLLPETWDGQVRKPVESLQGGKNMRVKLTSKVKDLLGWSSHALRLPNSKDDQATRLRLIRRTVRKLRKRNPNPLMESFIQLDKALGLVRIQTTWTDRVEELLAIWEETIESLVESKRVNNAQLKAMSLSHTKLLVRSNRSVHALFKLILDMKTLTGYTKSATDRANALKKVNSSQSFLDSPAQHENLSEDTRKKVIQAKKTQIELSKMIAADAEMKQLKETAYLNYVRASTVFEELKRDFPTVFQWYHTSEAELVNTGGRAAGESGRRFEERLREPDMIRAIMEVLSTTNSAALIISGHLKLFTNVTMQKRGKHYGEVDALLVDMTTGEIVLWIEQKANSGDLPKANHQRKKFMKFANTQKGAQFTLSSNEKCQGPAQWTDGVCDAAVCCKHFQQDEDSSIRRCIIITQLRTSSATTEDGARLAIQSRGRMHLYRYLFTLDITDDEQMLYLCKKVSNDLVSASEVVELYQKAGALHSLIVVAERVG